MGPELPGIVGLFKDPYHLLRAAKEVQKRGLAGCDAVLPYPIHGLDKMLGQKKSLVPWATLLLGLGGCLGGLALTIWTSAYDWPVNIGGKPFNSLAAFIPVIFECTILSGGLATVAALFMFCHLPDYRVKILNPQITNDVFALFVPASGRKFSESDVKQFMQECGAYEIKVVE